MATKIEDLKEPIEIGCIYSVPCLEIKVSRNFEEDWIDDDATYNRYLKEKLIQ